jgi:hypothetical protein
MGSKKEGGGGMTLGERCDEIVRLIDETLGDCAPVRPVSRVQQEEPANDLGEPLLRTA